MSSNDPVFSHLSPREFATTGTVFTVPQSAMQSSGRYDKPVEGESEDAVEGLTEGDAFALAEIPAEGDTSVPTQETPDEATAVTADPPAELNSGRHRDDSSEPTEPQTPFLTQIRDWWEAPPVHSRGTLVVCVLVLLAIAALLFGFLIDTTSDEAAAATTGTTATAASADDDTAATESADSGSSDDAPSAPTSDDPTTEMQSCIYWINDIVPGHPDQVELDTSRGLFYVDRGVMETSGVYVDYLASLQVTDDRQVTELHSINGLDNSAYGCSSYNRNGGPFSPSGRN